MKKYTVDYFLEKFDAIPEEKWTTRAFSNDEGQRCAEGHCSDGGTMFGPEHADLTTLFINNFGYVSLHNYCE